MKKVQFIIFICFSTILFDLSGQVLVRCPGGSFGSSLRCVPNEESAIDSIHITPCDCNDPRNLAGFFNSCLRTITICANNPIIPQDIDSFSYPYYTLDPESILGLIGPNGQMLSDFMDPDELIDPYSPSETQEAAFVLEIDVNTKCTSFEAWVQMDEEQTIKVFREVNENTEGEFDIIAIPASGDDCNRTSTTCYTIKNENLAKTISSGGSAFDIVSLPIIGEVSKVSIKNINITHARMNDLKIGFTPPLSNEKTLFREFSCTSANMDIGFAMMGSIEIPCPPISSGLIMPRENFYNPFESRYLDDPDVASDWVLSVKDEGTGNIGTLNSWELEVCFTENKGNVFVESDHTPIAIPQPNPNGTGTTEDLQTITSTITIPHSGTINSIGIEHLDIEHNYISDLKISLRNPAGDTIVLVDKKCGNEDDLKINFYDDAYLDTVSCGNIVPRPPSKPLESFLAFLSVEVQGDWVLIVEDLFGIEGGFLNSWALNIRVDCIDNHAASTGNILQGSLPRNSTYQVSDTITSKQRVIKNSFNLPANVTTVNYKAGKAVKLQNDFQVEQGQIFQASIEDCPNN